MASAYIRSKGAGFENVFQVGIFEGLWVIELDLEFYVINDHYFMFSRRS